MTAEPPITVIFMGGALVPGLPKQVTIESSGPITAEALMSLLESRLAIPDLRAKLKQHLIVVVDGTTIQHRQGWQTLVQPGARVSILAPMGGGCRV